MELIDYLFIGFGALGALAMAFALFLPARNPLEPSDVDDDRMTVEKSIGRKQTDR
ncbi:MAG: hypothetical protein ABW006_02620 [Hyphomicrobium sp.]